jgi:hypothetical protein
MKRSPLLMLILCIFFGLAGLKMIAASEKFELKTSEAILIVDQKGNLKIFSGKGLPGQVFTSTNSLWKIILKNSKNGKETILVPDNSTRLTKSGQVLQLENNDFSVNNSKIQVKVEFTISVRDDAFCFSGYLKSESDEWIFKEVNYPDLSGLRINDEKIKIYWPAGLGECFDNPQQFGKRTFEYPGQKGSMAWFSLNSPESGMYLGCHDPRRGSKKFTLSYSESDKSFTTSVSFPVYNSEFTIPEVMIKPYSGEWYKAAAYYRTWYGKNFKLPEISQWTKDLAGAMLVILKQQNGSVMWNYHEIDQICDIAEKCNLKAIRLNGWAIGGHDHLYPYYMPDNLMGGRNELEKAIERANKRGIKIILYSNGKLIDTSTDFYLNNGIETIILNEKMQPDIDFFIKYDNTTPVIFSRACPGSILWRKTIMDLALNAQSLGVEAFYIDQVGVSEPLMCFSKYHDHQMPQEAYTKYRVQMMHDIRNRMKEIDPDFCLLTEGTNDAMLTDIDVSYALGPGSTFTPDGFPEMFRYTFPESIIIQQNSDPVLQRFDANYAAIYGLRHKITCRYKADVEYYMQGKLPTEESYKHVNSPPNINKFNDIHEKGMAYLHDLIQFENDNGIFFRNGRFIDQYGITVSGNDILAKGFENGNRIGVVVWNRHMSEKRDFTLSVPGYRMIKASEPGKPEVKADSPVDANSLRLIIFEK